MDRMHANGGFGFLGNPDPELVLNVTVTRDGPQNVMTPLSLAEWRAVGGGFIPPQFAFHADAVDSGDHTAQLVDKVQGAIYRPAGAPLYQQAIAGWNAKAVTLHEATALEGFYGLVGELWNVHVQNVFRLTILGLTADAARRCILTFGNAATRVDVLSNGKVQLTPGGGSPNGTVVIRDSLAHPIITDIALGAPQLNHVGAGRYRLSDDKETVPGAWTLQGDGNKGLGPANVPGETAAGMFTLFDWIWVGDAADTMSAIGHKSALQHMGWTVTGY